LLAVGAVSRDKDGDRYGGMMIVRKILKCEKIRQLPQQIRREIPNALPEKKAFALGTTAAGRWRFLLVSYLSVRVN